MLASACDFTEELNLETQHGGTKRPIRFRRQDVSHPWTFDPRPYFDGTQKFYKNSSDLPIETDPQTKKSHIFPCQIISLSDFPDLRTAKVHTELRLDPLRAIQKVQDIMCHMVLFECTSCETRFPAFHPKKMPPFQLDATLLERRR